VAQTGLDELKDTLWHELNSESNKLAAITAEETIVHRDKDVSLFRQEMQDEGEDEDIQFIDDDEVEDLEDFEYDE
jgi:GTP-binding protein